MTIGYPVSTNMTFVHSLIWRSDTHSYDVQLPTNHVQLSTHMTFNYPPIWRSATHPYDVLLYNHIMIVYQVPTNVAIVCPPIWRSATHPCDRTPSRARRTYRSWRRRRGRDCASSTCRRLRTSSDDDRVVDAASTIRRSGATRPNSSFQELRE